MNAAVVYWSGTGNTEAMAQAVAEGIQAAGGTAEVCEVGQTDADTISKFDKIALGCPMISGKQLLLFGSYGWGDGEWMRDWCQRMEEAGAHLICEEGVIANETPDDAALEECRAAGKELITASV